MNRLPTHKRFKFQQLPKQQVLNALSGQTNPSLSRSRDEQTTNSNTQSTDNAADTVLEARQTTTIVNTERLSTQTFRATSDGHKDLLNPDRGMHPTNPRTDEQKQILNPVKAG